jgi:dihydrofolate reductase
MNTPTLSFVVAISTQTRAIGKNNDLLWHIPDDLQHFKKVTLGHPIIMGRKTFDSIGRVLPDRTNIVITRNEVWSHEGVTVCHSLEEALATAGKLDTEEIVVIGGSHIFEQALPFADRMYLTLVDDAKEGDVYFPAFDMSLFTEVDRKDGVYEGIPYSILTLEKKSD